MLPLPANMPPRYEPLIRLLEGVMVPPRMLASRWSVSEQTLSNDRAAGRNLPFTKLPGGSVRYYVSEIIGAELAGTRGPLSLQRIALELSTMDDVPETLAAAIMDRLRKATEAPG